MNRKAMFTIKDENFHDVDIYNISSKQFVGYEYLNDFNVFMVKYALGKKRNMAETLYPSLEFDIPFFGLGFSFHIDNNTMCVDKLWIYDKELFNEATSDLVWDSIEHKVKYKELINKTK